MADLRRYEVIVLDVLGEAVVESRAFGINNLGEVAGEVDFGNGDIRAVVWLYCPRFGLEARILHNLTVLAGASESGTVSTARDINDAGIVVGDEFTAQAQGRWPMIWRLPDYLPSSTTSWTERLQPFSGSSLSGRANAINNDDPAIVVGLASLDIQCGLSFPRSEVAFKYAVSGSDTSLEAQHFLGGEFSNDKSVGWDVATGDPVLACGEITDCGNSTSPCSGGFDGVTWDVGTDDVVVLNDAGSTRGAVARGVNDAGQVVGWFETGGEACLQRAAFWEDSTATVFDLGAVGFDALEPSFANRIGPRLTDGSVAVVGRAVVANTGVLWTQNAVGSWSSLSLIDEVSPICSLQLREAIDINADGWIVGNAIRLGVQKAVLLRPLPCPADLNGDCVVDSLDLGLLLGAWTCPSCECNADLDLDGVVGSEDLGLLLGNWSCTCEPLCGEESEDLMLSEEASPSLSYALLVLGFADFAAFNDWCSSAAAESVSGALESLWSILLAEQNGE